MINHGILEALTFTKGKCELCGSSKGEMLIMGYFDFLCPACFEKSEKILNRFAKHLLTLEIKELVSILEQSLDNQKEIKKENK
jgi:hypothetical protein